MTPQPEVYPSAETTIRQSPYYPERQYENENFIESISSRWFECPLVLPDTHHFIISTQIVRYDDEPFNQLVRNISLHNNLICIKFDASVIRAMIEKLQNEFLEWTEYDLGIYDVVSNICKKDSLYKNINPSKMAIKLTKRFSELDVKPNAPRLSPQQAVGHYGSAKSISLNWSPFLPCFLM